MQMEAIQIKNGSLKANYPYLVRAGKSGSTMTIELQNTTLYQTVENSIDCSSVFVEFEVKGTYKRLEGDEINVSGKYSLYGGVWKRVTAVNPFRLYTVVSSRGGHYVIDDASLQNVRIFVPGEDEFDTTGIIDVDSNNNSETSDKYFDLQGRRVLNPVKGSVYIVNGKKVIF